MGPTPKGSLPAWLEMEAQLTEQERALRDRFVDELIVDYDAVAACMRIGFSRTFAGPYAEQFIGEAYVQRRIKLVEQRTLDPELSHDYDANRVRAVLMRWAHSSHGPTAVAAARQLCSVMGLDAPTKIKQEIEHRGGVMMVPAIASLTDWEKTAVESQQKLAEFSRSDVH